MLDGTSSVGNMAESKRVLRKRSGIHYGLIDYSSEEEDFGPSHRDSDCNRGSRQNGVETTAANPPILNETRPIAVRQLDEACRPIIDDAPVFYPTEEEFSDTIGYIAKIRYEAEKYGICRIIPPKSWSLPCPLRDEGFWKHRKFNTRVQEVNKLQNREPVRKKGRPLRKRRRRGQLRFGMVRSRYTSKSSKQSECTSDSEDKFGFQSGEDYTLEEFQKYANEFKSEYFESKNPPVDEIEDEYWRIIENSSDEVEVLYGADIDTALFGSGFPTGSSSNKKETDMYVSSGWNLNNLPRLQGSILSLEKEDISGVLVPWLYVGMCFSSFCWHVEDHHLYSLNFMHFGEEKVWYGVPGCDAAKLEEAMRRHLPHLFEEQPSLLHDLVTQMSPKILKSEGISVCRVVQKPGEFVLTLPRAYHSGFNCGFNCAEAVNVAPVDWLPHGQCAVELYREQNRKTSLSHDKLLLETARKAVQELWELQVAQKEYPGPYVWLGSCSKTGVLTQAVKTRVEMEHKAREALNNIQTEEMKNDDELLGERECFSCFYDLHLSFVACECSPGRFSCLTHASQACACQPTKQLLYSRYNMSQLQTLVAALECNLSAVQSWAQEDLGLFLPLESKPVEEIDLEKKIEPVLPLADAEERNGMPCSISSRTEDPETIDLVEDSSSSEANISLGEGAVEEINSRQCVSLKTEEIREDSVKEKCPWPFVDLNMVEMEEDDPPVKNSRERGDLDMEQTGEGDAEAMNSEQCIDLNLQFGGVPAINIADEQLIPPTNYLAVRRKGKGSVNSVASEVLQAADCLARSNSGSSSVLSLNFSCDVGSSQHVGRYSCTPPGLENFPRPSTKLFGVNLSSAQSSECVTQVSKRTVEVLDFGSVMHSTKWCCKQAIFPKGYRSRVMFPSVLDPTKTCAYISEILSLEFLWPLFKVTLEEQPEISFTGVSPASCWNLVRDMLEKEIETRRKLGNFNVPEPLSLELVDGFELYGFKHQPILQAIEALDPFRRSTEYWSAKSASNLTIDDAVRSKNSSVKLLGVDISPKEHQEPNAETIAREEADDRAALRSLFNKGSLRELQVLQQLLAGVSSSSNSSSSWAAALAALQEEVNLKNPYRNRLHESSE